MGENNKVYYCFKCGEKLIQEEADKSKFKCSNCGSIFKITLVGIDRVCITDITVRDDV